MKNLTDPIFEEMEGTLQRIRLEYSNPLNMAMEAVSFLYDRLEKLKQIALSYPFADAAEEISFFKYIKPRLLSQLYLYNKVLEIELQRPAGCIPMARDFLLKEMHAIESYFSSHREFYNYYRTNSSYLDEQYFTRQAFDIRFAAGNSIIDADPRFTTSHDKVIAMCIANELLIDYLNKALDEIDHPTALINMGQSQASMLTWTDSKASLVELIYALHTQAVIDYGKSDVKDIAAHFERMFGIDLGDYYHTYLELRMRKTGRTKFLDNMREKLQKRMDEQEERG